MLVQIGSVFAGLLVFLLLSSVNVISQSSDALTKGMFWENSIKAPFRLDDDAHYKKLKRFTHGGSVQIKNNFIRITPDKPSRTGWLFNEALGPQGDFSVLLRFRISGSNQHLGGDGLAFWYTATNHFAPGLLLGGSDSFVGFGVLFDTYANAGSQHRDIVVVASDGKQSIFLNENNLDSFPGCNTKYRLWEGSDKFSIDQETIVKITFGSNTKVIVEIDPTASGDFTTCVEANLFKFLPKKDSGRWRNNAHISLSAATGALHDNHDVLEMIVTAAQDFDRLMEIHDEINEEPVVKVEITPNTTVTEVGDTVNVLSYELKAIDEKLQKLHHEIEHEVEKIAHRLEGIIENLQQQERKLEARVLELEKKTASEVFKQVESRLTQLEQSIYKNVNSNAVNLAQSVQQVKSESSSWRYPFYIFVLLVLGGFGYLTWTVVKINKKFSKDQQRYFD